MDQDWHRCEAWISTWMVQDEADGTSGGRERSEVATGTSSALDMRLPAHRVGCGAYMVW
jgi:hypothetical protein